MRGVTNQTGEGVRNTAIGDLSAKLEGTVRRKFVDAEREENEIGSNLIEHGAI